MAKKPEPTGKAVIRCTVDKLHLDSGETIWCGQTAEVTPAQADAYVKQERAERV